MKRSPRWLLPTFKFDREFSTEFHEAMVSPDFEYFGWNDTDSLFRLCDAQTGKERWSYQFQNSSQELMRIASYFSPDSRIVVAHAFPYYGMKVFEVESGKLLRSIEPQRCATLKAVAFSSSGEKMAVANDGQPICIFDSNDLSKEPARIEVPHPIKGVFFGHDDSIVVRLQSPSVNIKVFCSK